MAEVQGECHPDFEAVATLLGEQSDAAGFGGGALAVYHHGEKVVDLWAGSRDANGTPWSRDTVAVSASTTKGVLATAVAMCVDRELLDYEAPVATWWPEFAAHGKDEILLRHVMCHEAGLFGLRHLVADASELVDWDHMVSVLAAATPVHPAGAANGYHGLSIAWLAGEPVRRATGDTIGAFVRDEIAGPLGLDGLYIGLPDAEMGRLADPVAPDGGSPLEQMTPPDGEYPEWDPASRDPFPLVWRPQNAIDAIVIPGLFDNSSIDSFRDRARAEIPSATGCFTARSLARVYAALANGGEIDGTRICSSATVHHATTQQNDRPDLVLGLPACWRLGWHLAYTSNEIMGQGFGHQGYGGSGAWADPTRQLAMAYTTNRVGTSTALGDQRLPQLGGAVSAAANARVG
jgi:CubicO group peptidase (beta-lactamase class C family)